MKDKNLTAFFSAETEIHNTGSRFHPNKELVLTASGDGTAHIWQCAVHLYNESSSGRMASSEDELAENSGKRNRSIVKLEEACMKKVFELISKLFCVVKRGVVHPCKFFSCEVNYLVSIGDQSHFYKLFFPQKIMQGQSKYLL
jgi:hypothetical protein